MMKVKFPEHRTVDDVVATSKIDLYEMDFYAWTQEQARLLKGGDIERADFINIIEEIESLGRQQVSELRSRLKVLTLHLLKEIFQAEKATRSWASTIVNQRQEIEHNIEDSPSLKPQMPDIFRRAYAGARTVAAAETGLPKATFPVEPPFSLAQALDPSFWPRRSLADRS